MRPNAVKNISAAAATHGQAFCLSGLSATRIRAHSGCNTERPMVCRTSSHCQQRPLMRSMHTCVYLLLSLCCSFSAVLLSHGSAPATPGVLLTLAQLFAVIASASMNSLTYATVSQLFICLPSACLEVFPQYWCPDML